MPAGTFLPGMLIGCSLGRMMGLFIENYIIYEIHPSTYAIIGAASVMAGYSRLSFSLAVIMLETTENVNLFLPVIFALFVSFGVGRIFNRSLYVGSIRFKNIPFLVERPPKCNLHITADTIMSTPVFSLQPRATVKSLTLGLKSMYVHGFPVVDPNERLIGMIGREAIITLIKNKCWAHVDPNSFISDNFNQNMMEKSRRVSS